MPGPAMDVTAPYLEGTPTSFAQMHERTFADDARHFVRIWADSGMTSFKAYMHITRAELAAATNEVHSMESAPNCAAQSFGIWIQPSILCVPNDKIAVLCGERKIVVSR